MDDIYKDNRAENPHNKCQTIAQATTDTIPMLHNAPNPRASPQHLRRGMLTNHDGRGHTGDREYDGVAITGVVTSERSGRSAS
jgi:hypothetical protein